MHHTAWTVTKYILQEECHMLHISNQVKNESATKSKCPSRHLKFCSWCDSHAVLQYAHPIQNEWPKSEFDLANPQWLFQMPIRPCVVYTPVAGVNQMQFSPALHAILECTQPIQKDWPKSGFELANPQWLFQMRIRHCATYNSAAHLHCMQLCNVPNQSRITDLSPDFALQTQFPSSIGTLTHNMFGARQLAHF